MEPVRGIVQHEEDAAQPTGHHRFQRGHQRSQGGFNKRLTKIIFTVKINFTLAGRGSILSPDFSETCSPMRYRPCFRSEILNLRILNQAA